MSANSTRLVGIVLKWWLLCTTSPGPQPRCAVARVARRDVETRRFARKLWTVACEVEHEITESRFGIRLLLQALNFEVLFQS
jgi:hypothetical protein